MFCGIHLSTISQQKPKPLFYITSRYLKQCIRTAKREHYVRAFTKYNKANLRDLIAATGLVILLKLDSNRQFFSLCDLEIWWMTPKNNRAPLLCYFKLFASFRSHWWIQTGVTVWKHPIWIQIDNFFEPCNLEIWQMTLKSNRTHLPCCFKLCTPFRSHWWIQTGVTVQKRPSWVKFDDF